MIINVHVGSFAARCFPKLRKNCAPRMPRDRQASAQGEKRIQPYVFAASDDDKIILHLLCDYFLEPRHKVLPGWQRSKKKIYDSAFCVVWQKMMPGICGGMKVPILSKTQRITVRP